MTRLECTVPLPRGYRRAEVLAFHGRDAQSTAETVNGRVIRKGLVLQGLPAVIEMALDDGEAGCSLQLDGSPEAALAALLPDLARRLLGLHMDVEAFEARHVAHPELGPLIRAQHGLRVPMAASPFEALTWAITGQQINVGVASQLRRRLIQLAGLPHSSGLWCHPDAKGVAALSEAALATARFSAAKAAAILAVSRMAAGGALPLEMWMAPPLPVSAIEARLLAIKGIGPWTVNYTLLRGYGHADGTLHGDVAVRNALQRMLGQTDKVTTRQAEAWLDQFAPWRSLVAAHLWGSLRLAEGQVVAA